METVTIECPAMYADHHVVAVRQLLLDLPGVRDVYASSSFQVVEVQIDPAVTGAAAVKAALTSAGYIEALPVPVERGNGEGPFFRHTAAYAQTGEAVAFAQTVPAQGRPLWPCPGLGAIPLMEEEVTHGPANAHA